MDDALDLGALARAIWRRKAAIIIPTLIAAALAFIIGAMLTRRYQSESRVLVEGRENIVLRAEAEKSAIDRSPVDQETVTSQVQLVLSRDLAREVIGELGLSRLP